MNACTWGEGGEGGHIPHLDGWVGGGCSEDNHVHVCHVRLQAFQTKGYVYLYTLIQCLSFLNNFGEFPMTIQHSLKKCLKIF